MRLVYRVFAAAVIVFFAGGAVVALSPAIVWTSDLDSDACCLDIAHAGGLLQGEAYTNSREALDTNLALGRKVFEIDLIETLDGQIVLAHDWDAYGGAAPTLAQYRADRADLTILTLAEFAEWQVTICPTCTIITDPKMSFETFWAAFTRAVAPEARHAAYVLQAYSVEELESLGRIAPDQPAILTIYRMGSLTEAQMQRAAAVPALVAVTMPMHRLPKLARATQEITGKPVFTHGYPWMMASDMLLKTARFFGATGFYRD